MHTIIENTQQWLENVVIGLNLCPFAKRPFACDQIRIAVTETHEPLEILNIIKLELDLLDVSPKETLETTLVVTPNALLDFYDYNDFLSRAEMKIKKSGYKGVFQIASFHPRYQFQGTAADDVENLTNRAPYPIFHLLRESSLEAALSEYPNPESIYEQNIQTMQNLDQERKARLFSYLFR
jgi:hypothetical protein